MKVRKASSVLRSDSTVESEQSSDVLNEADQAFVQRLRQAIAEESVSAFARRCEMPEATMRSYLNGKKPVYDKLVRIADACHVSIEWLATGRVPQDKAQSIDLQASKTRELIAQVEQVWPLSARLALLDDLIARAQTAAEMSALRAAVAQLQKHLPTHPTDDNPEAESDD